VEEGPLLGPRIGEGVSYRIDPSGSAPGDLSRVDVCRNLGNSYQWLSNVVDGIPELSPYLAVGMLGRVV